MNVYLLLLALVDASLVLLDSGECLPRAAQKAGEKRRKLHCIKLMGTWDFHEKFSLPLSRHPRRPRVRKRGRKYLGPNLKFRSQVHNELHSISQNTQTYVFIYHFALPCLQFFFIHQGNWYKEKTTPGVKVYLTHLL